MAQRKETLSKGTGLRRTEKPVSTASKPLTRVSTPREISLVLRSTVREAEKAPNSRKSSDIARSSTQCSFHPAHHLKSSSAIHSPPSSSQTISARIQALERSNATLTAQLYAEKAKNVELEIVVKECMEKLTETMGLLGLNLESQRGQEGRKSVNLKIKPADKPPGRAMSADTSPDSLPPPHPLLLLTTSLSQQLQHRQSLFSSLFLSLQHLSAFISRFTQLIHATKTGTLGQLLRMGMKLSKENGVGSVEEGIDRVEKARRELGVIEAQLIDWYADFTANKCVIS